jgi:hypothetical protein
MIDTQEASQEFRELDERLRAGGLTPVEQERWAELRAAAGAGPLAEEPAGVLWDDGPVAIPLDLPVDPPRLVPPPDPAYDAIIVEEAEEIIPEVAAEDVEEVLPADDGPVALTAVSWVDEDGPAGEVVSLDALLATPPPANAESLAPPLPPPLPSHAPSPEHAVTEPPRAIAGPAGPPAIDRFAPSPSFVSGDHRIVLHTVEGQVLRGSLANADLADPELPLIQPNGAVARVPAEQVKAIFFMLPAGVHPPAAAGTRVRVTFGDGRQISGLSPDYSPDSHGFFVLPLDGRTHTARVWVYRAAVRQIDIG